MIPGAPNRRKRYLMQRQQQQRQARRILKWNREAIEQILHEGPDAHRIARALNPKRPYG